MSLPPSSAPLQGLWQLVHGPLAHWAQALVDDLVRSCAALRDGADVLNQ